jgi:hypothetical protein
LHGCIRSRAQSKGASLDLDLVAKAFPQGMEENRRRIIPGSEIIR